MHEQNIVISQKSNSNWSRWTYVQEVGDESKLAQSFERIRDLVRRKRLQRVDEENTDNSRLERIVREVMQRHAEEEAFNKGKCYICILIQI